MESQRRRTFSFFDQLHRERHVNKVHGFSTGGVADFALRSVLNCRIGKERDTLKFSVRCGFNGGRCRD